MRFYTSNIIPALRLAIKVREIEEKQAGYLGDTGILANWKMFLLELEKYETVNI